ncbi:LCP family protein [Kocuria soli]|uniref:LCP family protein n=1 Tax=Kocuria soli TaxID=2485125 RepID=UPI001F2ECAD0|nr:LCP family protein [Kocuria soli]
MTGPHESRNSEYQGRSGRASRHPDDLRFEEPYGRYDDPYDAVDDDSYGEHDDRYDEYDEQYDDVLGEVGADENIPRFNRVASWHDALINPRFTSPQARNKRAALLLGGTLLVPGSAQVSAGNRRLGRIALTVTVVCWVLLLLVLLSALFWRTPLIFLATNGLTSPVVSICLVALAIGWGLLFLDALRLARPGLLSSKARTVAIVSTIVAMVVTSGGLGYTAHLLNVTRSTVGEIFGGGLPFRPVDGRYNIMLMGADAGADRVGLRPDSMTILSIDAKSGQTVTISLPRNLQNVPFPEDSPMHDVYPDGYNCGDECLLNAVYTDVTENHADVYGDAEDPGAEAMMDAASGALGIDVQGYAMIDMAGFEQLIDAMGGITIDVGGQVPIGGGTNELTGLPNPIDGYIEPGVQHLDGYHALWYARSREGASDYDRQARQRCVQTAMLKQLNPVNVVAKFEEMAAAGTQVVRTDIPQSSIGSFVDLAVQAQDYELVGYAAGPPYYDAMFPTYPDYDLLHADVAEMLANADGSEDAQPAPAGAASTTAQGTDSAGTTLALGGGLGSQALPVTRTETEGTTAPTELSENGTCSVP